MAESRVSIRPSALGSKGLLLFAALDLAFLATNYSNLFFLLLAFSAVLGGLGALWSWRNLRGVQIEACDVGLAAAGTERGLSVRLHAPGRTRFDLAVELPLSDKRTEVAYAPMLRGSTEIRGSIPPQPRGICTRAEVHLTSRFPFGFFVARARSAMPIEIVTHPEPIAFADTNESAGSPVGDDGLPVSGRGASLAGLRPFRTGDAVADVHWKATARRGTAVVKERERESQSLVEVTLDRRSEVQVFEQALSRATTLVLSARHGAAVRLRSQEVDLVVDPERGGAEAALRWLAEALPLPKDALPPPRTRGAIRLPDPNRGRA